MKVKDIGEQGLLRILQKFCPAEIVGDDCAVLPTNPQQSLAVTTDMLVDGVHFSDRTTSPYDAGWRAAAANLSDLAAMGARPLAVTVALAVTADTAVDWVEEFYRGMTACLEVYHAPIAGGDVVRSPVVTISITAFGQVEENRTIRRSNAISNWAIVATGFHGASRAGLELLLNPEFGQNLEKGDRTSLILAHQQPKPRLDVLPVVWEILDAAGEFAIAGMDSSDGLADAIVQVCRASGVGAKVDRTKIPIPHSLSEIVSTEKALDWALYGGEDFELVLFLPIDRAKLLVERIGDGAAIVGITTESTDIWLSDSSGICPDFRLEIDRGFQHF
ncbi:MAG: thiamine-phosphate kinase [Microcoleus sp. PH2017_10_PVI_O_A]|uniref:thiamine-phosphate kinase n=1 Tax=unclassified Microcoleus TaxID=2642155 RepID=UPI001D38771C|nr:MULTISPECIES: thiamine-phosphate kinase [unclassified Microcoleus]TAE83967.1 MAG: thiamine-phosphate kinase [Oscillatoriales cyanobacterium]MCC3405693.1 thiamine-phosphate kinase [Microcoleus sp. PH2017_10_PVI_O_A]MCC3460850.1 thiamine-phosphate kinase [Microcoleus sp. PH2017_11_PCY_U_A]MCC3478158.1 thiamine-phosphate kinase [Microcoleus sp. PH2017_12_PCY_D_A]MCC3559032.1 thiamine-phosphate kinase [Microcoleus sp. PH2017_27_LUM_O_A]